MKLLCLFMILFARFSHAQPVNVLDGVNARALEGANAQLEVARTFFAQPGELENELNHCDPANPTFSAPALPIAVREKELCDLMPGEEFAGPGFSSECALEDVTACSFKVRRTFSVSLPTLVPPTPGPITQMIVILKQVGTPTPPPKVYANQPYPAASVVHCEIVAAVGVVPTWSCGGGYADSWSDKLPSASVLPPSPQPAPILPRVQSAPFLKSILVTAGVVRS